MRLAVQVVLDQVLFLHKFWSDRPSKVITLRVARRAQAHVTVGVDDAVRREDAVRGDEVLKRFHRLSRFHRINRP